MIDMLLNVHITIRALKISGVSDQIFSYASKKHMLCISKYSAQWVEIFMGQIGIPVSILYKSIAGHYRSVRVEDGPITARYRFIKNASWDIFIDG